MGRTTAIQKGKMRTDGMFALRQLVEKRFEVQGRMVVGFVDLLRKMVYADDLAKNYRKWLRNRRGCSRSTD